MEATEAADRSMPPVSMVSVWQAARIASGMAKRMVVLAQCRADRPGTRRPGGSPPAPAAGRCSGMIGRSRSMRRQSMRPVAPRGGGRGGGHIGRFRRRVRYAPIMTTTTMITPWMMVVRLGSTRRKVRSVRIRDEDVDRDDGAEQAAATADEADPAEDDGRHALQRVGAGDRGPDAGGHRQRQAAAGGEDAGDRVRRDPRARRR